MKITKPLLFIDIDIGDETGKKRITVYPKDEPKKLARQFCEKYGIYDKSVE